MSRPKRDRYVADPPRVTYFKPQGVPMFYLEEARLSVEGLEALRLADLEDLSASEAAERMRVSRHTFGRVLAEARRVIASSLVRGLALRIEGGHWVLSEGRPDETGPGGAAARMRRAHDGPETDMATEREKSSVNIVKIAVPSDHPGGLDARVSGHFGHCDRYTLVEIDADGVKRVETMDNPPHQEGGCLAPVRLLADRGVTTLLAGGMGRRPLMGFHQAGIEVYFAGDQPTVGQSVAAFRDGQLPVFSIDAVCGGGGGCGGR